MVSLAESVELLLGFCEQAAGQLKSKKYRGLGRTVLLMQEYYTGNIKNTTINDSMIQNRIRYDFLPLGQWFKILIHKFELHEFGNMLQILNEIEKLEKMILGEVIELSTPPKYRLTTIKQYYWHSGITGRHGEIIFSILQKGVKPKSALNEGSGSFFTGNPLASYASNSGKGALQYLKSANGYNWEPGGLPFVLALEISKFTKHYSFDTDIVQGNFSDDDCKKVWFAFMISFNSLKDFCDLNSKNSFLVSFQKVISTLGDNISPVSVKSEIWNFINHKENVGFFNKQTLSKIVDQMSTESWERFIRILNSMSGYFVQNILRVGGWNENEIRRVYVMSPGGDKDWLKWAANMLPSKDFITSWENWGAMKYDDAKYFPGQGKLIRIK